MIFIIFSQVSYDQKVKDLFFPIRTVFVYFPIPKSHLENKKNAHFSTSLSKM